MNNINIIFKSIKIKLYLLILVTIIGYVVKLMSEENVLNIIHVLITLIQHTDWTTRHGGLLGLKYLLVVRKVSYKHFI